MMYYAKCRITLYYNEFNSHFRSTADTLYTLPSVLNKRSTSLGYGTKYDFTKDQKNKAPYYEVKSDFGKDHALPSYTFGISRHFYEKVN